MKKLGQFVIILVSIIFIIFPLVSISSVCLPLTCKAAERVTPHKPEVRYTEPRVVTNEPPKSKEIKKPLKRKVWPWVVGGVIIGGALAALSGGGGGGGEDNAPNTVDVDVSW